MKLKFLKSRIRKNSRIQVPLIDKAWNPVPRIQNPRMSYSLTWRDLEATSKKTSGRQEIIFCKTLAVKGLNIPQGYPQFITESLKEEQKEHS